VVVTGHTDSQGGFDHNVDLSRRRAAAIVAILTRDFGIAPARLTPFGAGMAAPVSTNENDAGRAQNRRVEIVRR
jgi:outer membrane protein OmpA-like peptidoglycan-associated protein